MARKTLAAGNKTASPTLHHASPRQALRANKAKKELRAGKIRQRKKEEQAAHYD